MVRRGQPGFQLQSEVCQSWTQTIDSEVAFYAKNAASIQDYRRLTLHGDGGTKAAPGDAKTLKDSDRLQHVQKADSGKKRGAVDKDKSGSWTCDQCLKRNWQYISKDSTVERTNCFHCRASKNPSKSLSLV